MEINDAIRTRRSIRMLKTDPIPKKVLEKYLKRASEYRETSDRYHFPPGTDNLEEKRQAFMAVRNRLSNAPNAIIVYVDKHLRDWPCGGSSVLVSLSRQSALLPWNMV